MFLPVFCFHSLVVKKKSVVKGSEQIREWENSVNDLPLSHISLPLFKNDHFKISLYVGEERNKKKQKKKLLRKKELNWRNGDWQRLNERKR